MNSSSVWAALKRFDAYAKPMDDFRIRTRSGGVLTVASGLVMIFLFASEFRDYLQPAQKEELFVDTSRTGKLKINVDIVFSRISCDFLGIDAMDVSGEQHIDIGKEGSLLSKVQSDDCKKGKIFFLIILYLSTTRA